MKYFGIIFILSALFVSCGQQERSTTSVLSDHFAAAPKYVASAEGMIFIKENTDRVFQSIVYDSVNGAIFYKEMLGEGHEYVTISEDEEMKVKQLDIRKDVGDQKLLFAVWNRKENNTFGFYVDVDKTTNGTHFFQYQENKKAYVIRTDTDVTKPAELIYDLFPGLPKKKVNPIQDPDAGVYVDGGKEFVLPATDIDKPVPLKLSCRAHNDDQGHFCKFLLYKNAVPPTIVTGEKVDLVDAADYSKVILKDSNVAKTFFDQMNIKEAEVEGKFVKLFSTVQDPGAQKLRFTCWRTKDSLFGCDLLVEKLTSAAAYKVHDAKNDAKILIYRNDTDYADPAKVLDKLFPTATRKKVKTEKDPQIGYSIPGGQEFIIGDDASMKLACRYQKETEEEYEKAFCKFVVKKP